MKLFIGVMFHIHNINGSIIVIFIIIIMIIIITYRIINEQLSRANAIKTVRAVEYWRKTKDGEKRKFKNKYEELALEALVANNEIKSEKVAQLLASIDTSSTTRINNDIDINDIDDDANDDIELAALGLTDVDTPPPQSLSALNFFVRAGESLERKKNLKTYRYDNKNQNFSSSIMRADTCVDKLRNNDYIITEFTNNINTNKSSDS